ncbi:ABC transporter permease [Bacilli bacterium]|nr:ABC transporter permease [Bacilli bacterium]
MKWFSKKKNMVIMLAPSLLVYTVFIIASIVIAFCYSLTRYSGIGKARWLGLDNYLRILGDPYFRMALKNSIIILAVSLVTLTVLGFFLANLYKMKLHFSGFGRASIFSPAIIAPIIVGIIWIFILDPEIGIINAVLRSTGRPDLTRLWIGGDALSPFSFALVFFWRQLGFVTTIFLAGLNLIPEEVYESAAIAGARLWQRVWYITIPMMRQTFTIVVLLIITETFKIFEIVLQLTNGGPNHLSEVLITYTYTTTFKGGEYGYGMSLAMLTFLVSLVFSFAYMMVTRDRGGDAA